MPEPDQPEEVWMLWNNGDNYRPPGWIVCEDYPLAVGGYRAFFSADDARKAAESANNSEQTNCVAVQVK